MCFSHHRGTRSKTIGGWESAATRTFVSQLAALMNVVSHGFEAPPPPPPPEIISRPVLYSKCSPVFYNKHFRPKPLSQREGVHLALRSRYTQKNDACTLQCLVSLTHKPVRRRQGVYRSSFRYPIRRPFTDRVQSHHGVGRRRALRAPCGPRRVTHGGTLADR